MSVAECRFIYFLIYTTIFFSIFNKISYHQILLHEFKQKEILRAVIAQTPAQILPLDQTGKWATDAEVFARGPKYGPMVHFDGVEFGRKIFYKFNLHALGLTF